MVPAIDVSQHRYAIVSSADYAAYIVDEEKIRENPYAVIEYVKVKTFNEFPFLAMPPPRLLQTYYDLNKAYKSVNNYQHQDNRRAIYNLVQFVFYNPVFYAEFGFSVFHEVLILTDQTFAIEKKYKEEYLKSNGKFSYMEIKSLIIRFLNELYHYYKTIYSFSYVNSMDDLYTFLFI